MTFLLRHPKDGRLHWSDLKHMSLSPKHALYMSKHPKPPTTAMRFGSAVDRIVFGAGPVVRCDISRETKAWECLECLISGEPYFVSDAGARNGKKWEETLAFAGLAKVWLRKEHDAAMALFVEGAMYLTTSEYDAAMGAAGAVHGHPVAKPYLGGRWQVVHQWESHGLPFAAGIEGERGGFDVLGDGFIADLKVTPSARPEWWERHARQQLYFEQVTLYADAVNVPGRFVIGVESKPPHDVTVLEVTDAMANEARKRLTLWCESVKQCEQSGHWPGYVQSTVKVEPAEWDFTDNETENE